MKKICLLFAVFTLLNMCAAELDSLQFLKIVRNASELNGSTYGVLDGSAVHVRREKGRKITEEYPCFMALIITPEKSITQIILNNEEGYLVGRLAGKSTSIRSIGKKGSVMERIGISPRELSMSFLDDEFVRELPSQSVRMVKCRVMLLKNKNNSEWTKIYVAAEYFFVLKAEFFKNEPAEKSIPDRTLEVDSFAKKNDLYYTSSLALYGPGWRTDISFDKADMNRYNPENGTSIFRRLK